MERSGDRRILITGVFGGGDLIIGHVDFVIDGGSLARGASR